MQAKVSVIDVNINFKEVNAKYKNNFKYFQNSILGYCKVLIKSKIKSLFIKTKANTY